MVLKQKAWIDRRFRFQNLTNSSTQVKAVGKSKEDALLIKSYFLPCQRIFLMLRECMVILQSVIVSEAPCILVSFASNCFNS